MKKILSFLLAVLLTAGFFFCRLYDGGDVRGEFRQGHPGIL